ncbi:efflux transporter outer membrane subunit [Chitinibacter sp. S2-10]|uniref:efflux transporter outer membrane subunit n=1 Tax=Chitinibacter sp. S2-10 TaxID=3373597 RepID=UPI003977426A
MTQALTLTRTQLGPRLLTLALLGILAGCTSLAPEYIRPASPVAAGISNEYSGYVSEIKAAEDLQPYTQWEQLFVDSGLQNLIRQALIQNRDYRIAAFNIEKVRAQYQISQANRLPTIGISASGNSTGDAGSSQSNEQQYTASVGLTSYELDFFGRLKSLSDAALAQYLGTQAAQQSLRLSLIAEVANAYYNLAADQANLQRIKETLTSRQASHELIERRFAAGVIGELDVQQSRVALETARADLARNALLVLQDKNALRVLTGGEINAADLPKLGAGNWRQVVATPQLPTQLKSDILLRRPDVQRAEYLLQSANANIGAARAAFFPTITLTTGIGVASSSLSDLFSGGSGAWLFAPQLTLPIFDGGRNQANLDAAKAEREIALATYEKTIQQAFREVSNSLSQTSSDLDRLAAQQSQLAAAKRAYDIAQARYNSGIGAYLDVLESQRVLYQVELAFNNLQLQLVVNQVNLYKATALY